MIATHLMSYGTQAVVYLFAVVAFIVAAVLAFLGRAFILMLIASGLALVFFIQMWNAFALS